MTHIGIRSIGTYVPAGRTDLEARMEEFGIDVAFLDGKTGARQVALKAPDEDTSDLAAKAFADLVARTSIEPASIDCIVVVTQNPDGCGLPHVSAILQHRLGLRSDCAAFDLSLGCSGFVTGLSVMSAFMAANGMTRGVLITADPYSKIIDPADKNTALLFGDGAAATLLEADPMLPRARGFKFATAGDQHLALVNQGGTLVMNGRAVFNYSAQAVPPLVKSCLAGAGIEPDQVDLFLFHQGSRYIVDTLTKRLALPPEKVPMELAGCGNTVSSSIPLLLANRLSDNGWRRMLLCGFGVGLSAAACVLERP